MGKHYDELTARMAEVIDLNHAESLLNWDQETYMPAGGAMARSHHLGTLSKVTHDMAVAPAIGRLIKAAAKEQDVTKSAVKSAMLREAKRGYDRSKKLPSDFVAEMSRTRSQAQQVWIKARQASDFKQFAPWLKKNLDFARRAADYFGWQDHPYDALLDVYEPGMKSAEVKAIFANLRNQTVPLVHAIARAAAHVSDACLSGHFAKEAQQAFAEDVSRKIGYDYARGRLDYTAHPFCTNFSRDDVRITTRADESFYNTLFFSVLHEAGHGMYEQGIAPTFDRTPLGGGASLGLHESQSRLWENLVGRSRSFWQHFYPQLQEHLPHFKDVPLDVFYGAINKVEPSLIRIEADELTYNMHIFTRFELELALLEGSLKVKELPEAWNAKYHSYLGITPPNDAMGCLQDIHWSIGLIGYFPTYTLGNIISVQLLDKIKRDIPDLYGQIARGEFGALLGWLNKTIHQHGRRFPPAELIKRATGQSLTAAPYVAYLTGKFSEIYGLADEKSNPTH
jgi:carboxypeptidase Taq